MLGIARKGSCMNDPFEEERQARFVRPIEAFLPFVRQAEAELVASKETRDPKESVRLFDNALNLLFHGLNLSMPVAHVRSQNGHLAFMWVDCSEKTNPHSYRWVFCSRDGAWMTGNELAQEICELVVNRLFQNK